MAYLSTKILSSLTGMFFLVTLYTTFSMNNIMIEWEVVSISSSSLSIPILLDPTSTMFMTTVLLIASSVMQFAKTYMANDKFSDRFIILVLMFVTSMMMLILLPHTMFLLLGWDGLGITSFVLVIYYNNPKSLGAGMITAMTNRIGDVMLLITIALMLSESNWLTMNQWMSNSHTQLSAVMVMVAAMTKSAQMPFSSWLPAAMAAPTPVSALVHSSTLVTAGVYLLYRFFPMMEKWNQFKPALLVIATMTMLMASASAMAECDMKKIIALSTLSQVAMMMFTLSLGAPEIAFFHLITHALFKALLFICAGNMIDIHHHSQDLRLMGNLINQLPITTTSILIANMALCGAPFLAGFYSKDLIIESSTMLMMKSNMIISTLFVIATILTTAYSARMSMHMLLAPTQSPTSQYSNENENHAMSVMTLSLMAIVGGAMTNWLLITPVAEPNFSSVYKYLAPLMMATGLLTGLMAYKISYSPPKLLVQMNCYMWFTSPISTHLAPKAMMQLPLLELKETDQGWSFIPYMVYSQSRYISSYLMSSQHSLTTSNMSCIFLILLWLSMSVV
uniref:NADH-ubiquinone oxidoreductase chain 5 n=1 Tax=Nereis zonata TaxID=880888 RepID=A0A7M3UIY0_9ANNE|nr:NADH dehydrogenase subunit 5 [Nereis zonata]QOH99545.1 NADH dehydrogenase subunit 5 [Nereis zonata]